LMKDLKSPVDSFHPPIELEDVLSVLKRQYVYRETTFTNGDVRNSDSENQASGLLLAWAVHRDLSAESVLRCYGRHYAELDPAGTDHANIRAVMKHNMIPGAVTFGRPDALTPRSSKDDDDVRRFSTEDPRMSGGVVHSNVVYLSGQVPNDTDAPLRTQVAQTLEKIDALLAEAGSSKSRLLTAQLWLRDMDDFSEMNEIWNDWIDPTNKPVRACVEANMALPGIRFEAMVTAAASCR